MPFNKGIGAMFIITGTCVGAGMLALPVAGGEIGLLPLITVMLFTYILMTLGGLLYAEISLWFTKETHLTSISNKYLGSIGKWLSCLLYLFISYISLVAYLSEGSKLIYTNLDKYFTFSLSPYATYFLYLLAFCGVLLAGTKFLLKLNEILIIGLIVTYLGLTFNILPHLDHNLLLRANWELPKSAALFPVMLSAFSYPGIVPAMASYLDRDIKTLRLAIVGGTTLAFVLYIIWIVMVLGVIDFDKGPSSLQSAMTMGHSAIIPLQELLGKGNLSIVSSLFGFFAITTSFFGVGYGLLHFIADSFQVEITRFNKYFLILLIIVPTMIFTINFDQIFILALDLTGGIGDASISLLFPAVVVIIGIIKEKRKINTFYSNIFILLSVIAFAIYQICAEISRFI